VVIYLDLGEARSSQRQLKLCRLAEDLADAKVGTVVEATMLGRAWSGVPGVSRLGGTTGGRRMPFSAIEVPVRQPILHSDYVDVRVVHEKAHPS
jgi:hypothetical protein